MAKQLQNDSNLPAAISQPPSLLQPPTVEKMERARMWTSALRVLPDFLIIGAQKAGTTSLYAYLGAHPKITAALAKEVHFFDYNFGLGEAWYRAHFPTLWERWRGDFLVTGEASPYYLFYPLAAPRAKQIVPKAKIIVLLRNPVDRAYSHFHHQVRLGLEELPFEQAIEQEATRLQGEFEQILVDDEYYSFNYQNYSYLARGMYAEQLERWFRFFPREQFLILDSSALYQQTARTLERTLEFLQVPPGPPQTFGVKNDGSYAPMDERVRAQLSEFFAPHNERLFALLNDGTEKPYPFDWN